MPPDLQLLLGSQPRLFACGPGSYPHLELFHRDKIKYKGVASVGAHLPVRLLCCLCLHGSRDYRHQVLQNEPGTKDAQAKSHGSSVYATRRSVRCREKQKNTIPRDYTDE